MYTCDVSRRKRKFDFFMRHIDDTSKLKIQKKKNIYKYKQNSRNKFKININLKNYKYINIQCISNSSA